jgi:TatA/E family protein of Tat protein translocase
MAIGTTEWLIIAGVAVFLFGAPKVISWAKSLGQAKKEFNKASSEDAKDG